MREPDSSALRFFGASEAWAATLPALARECYLPYYAYLWEPGAMDAYLERVYAPDTVLAELRDPNVRFEIAERAGRAIGFFKLWWRHDHPHATNAAYLERVYVSPTAGRGVGTALVARAMHAAADAGRDRIWLRAMDSAVKPIERYRALGFRDVATEELSLRGMIPAYRGMRALARALETPAGPSR